MLFRHSSIPVNILAVAVIIRPSIQGRTKEEALPLPTSFPAQSIVHREVLCYFLCFVKAWEIIENRLSNDWEELEFTQQSLNDRHFPNE